MNPLNSSITEPLYFNDLTPKTFSGACRAKLEELKNRLVRKLAAEFSNLREDLVRLAVTEADALASLTGVPHLLLPALAEEKVQEISNWSHHQQAIFPQRRSTEFGPRRPSFSPRTISSLELAFAPAA